MKPSIQSAIAVIALTLMASNHALLQRTGKAAQKTEVTTQASTTALSTKQAGDQIPEQNLQIPDDLKPCAERLRTIYSALTRYQKNKGSMPDWLSDLVPDYLSAETLIWPEDGPKSTPLAADRHLPCSFGYQYSSSLPLPGGKMSYREFKDRERKVWGDVVPLVRYYIGKQCLNISFDGRIYMSGTAWESEIRRQAGAPEVLMLREISVPASLGPGPVRPVAQAAATTSTSKYRIPPENLEIPGNCKLCAENLHKIYEALGKYEKDKGRMPDWLSDLVPDYLNAERLFCPDDPSHTTRYWSDPNLPCSYCYELNPTELRSRPPLDRTMRHYKTLQRKLFGYVVPIVRCFHHGRVLNLAWDGQIYTSEIWFEHLFIPDYSHRMLSEVGLEEAARPVKTSATPAVQESKVLAFDDFDGKLTLKWEIINPNLSNFSLTKKPGTLTITTKNGHFSKSYTNYENLFLIDSPVALGEDLQITTRISSFQPEGDWNQAGIVCWDDEDNYVKFVHEWSDYFGGQSFTIGREIAGADRYAFYSVPSGAQTVWLRIVKRGSSYQCFTSTDGKSFVVQGSVSWKTDSPRRVGLYANNGSTRDTSVPNLDASFEFFEVATVASKPGEAGPAAQAAATTSTGKYRIPPENLKIPDDCKACAENLRKIYDALQRHKKDKGQLPNALSDLMPDYLDEQSLLCPTQSVETAPLSPDPKLPCSYGYQYSNRPVSGNKTQRQWKDEQRELCGDVVPLVRCYGHGQCLNLSFGGQIYVSSLVWEKDLDPQGGALRQSASPSQSGTSAAVSTPIVRGEGGVSFEDDLEAFIREMDSTYPFFELKRIRGDWEQTKNQLREQVKTCQSDERLLEIAKDGVLCLRDSHMWFRGAKAPVPQRPPRYYPGISFLPATDERVVVMHGREELDPDLKSGTIVTKINGQDARQYLEERARVAWAEGGVSGPQRVRLFEYRIPLRGETKGENHTVTILADGKERVIELTADTEARGWPHTYNLPKNMTQVGRSCWYTKLPSGAGYIYLRRVDGSTGPGLKEAFSTHADAKGWIIDLRGNGGGGYDQALSEALRALPSPLAVLVDAGCMSAGETLARDFVQRGSARLFGSKTAGASSAKRTWTFPSGVASLSVPTRSRWGIGGKPIEFNGIEPHIEVEAVPEELAQGLNSGICRAEQYLAETFAAEGR